MFTRVRKIGNGNYLYEEHRYREGNKVRSRSVYKGRADGVFAPRKPDEPTGGSMLLNDTNLTKNAEARAEGKFTTEQDLGGDKNAAPSESGDKGDAATPAA